MGSGKLARNSKSRLPPPRGRRSNLIDFPGEFVLTERISTRTSSSPQCGLSWVKLLLRS